ncbi:MAG TPA: hypothetical protein VFU47_03140 [Armatimonadota bacterium]|nr:hypothetical protein [Armatimonadota bacterium]
MYIGFSSTHSVLLTDHGSPATASGQYTFTYGNTLLGRAIRSANTDREGDGIGGADSLSKTFDVDYGPIYQSQVNKQATTYSTFASAQDTHLVTV